MWIDHTNRKLLWQTYAEDATKDVGLSSTNALSLNTWHHIVVTKDGSTATIYIDGVAEDTTEAYSGNSYHSDEPLTIGGETSMHDMFDGKIDEVAIWSDDLSAAEVAALYNGVAGTTGTGTPLSAAVNSGSYVSANELVGYWKMDEGTGGTVADSSTKSNTGTLTGSMTDSDWTAFSTTQSQTTRAVTEGGSTSSYTLALDQEPTTTVTVTLSSDDAAAATATVLVALGEA